MVRRFLEQRGKFPARRIVGKCMLSVLDLFKVGLGPSSSHTMGPMIIARRFLEDCAGAGSLTRVHRVAVELQGSLALTGAGHGTDRAVLLGLAGERPGDADPDACDRTEAAIRDTHRLKLLGSHEIEFDPRRDLDFAMEVLSDVHPNSMVLRAFDAQGELISEDMYFSLGGGFVASKEEIAAAGGSTAPNQGETPRPFKSAADLLSICKRDGVTIAEFMLAHEAKLRPREETEAALDTIWAAMSSCIERGLRTKGQLPGGLKVTRRAPALYGELMASGERANESEVLLDRLNVYAMAVNEENAAGGRVVTAPTNGAAGILPAVIKHYCDTHENAQSMIRRFLLTAGAIGLLYKMNASISGAEMGCQGEVGVACSMAAAGLAAVWGGTNAQVEHAAEVGMEHNLGLTCDPVGGLVQIPCIERNAVGAVKAVNAARLAIRSDGSHRVTLDQVIESMRQTGLDMNHRYKETSQGGLAVNVVEC